MKFSIIKITVFIHTIIFCTSVHLAVTSGNTAKDSLVTFNSSMAKIKDGITRLQHEDLTTFSSIELITSGDPEAAQNGYKKATETIKARIILTDIIQEEILHASELHAKVADSYSAEWNEKMKLIASDFEVELSDAIESLDNEADKFSKVLDTEKLDIFDHMAKDKTALIESIKDQHVDASQFDTSFFTQLDEMVKLSKSVDKTQLIFLQFAVNCLDLKQERVEIENTMKDLNMANYLDILHDQSIDAGNISSTLDFTFAQFMKTSTSSLPPPPPAQEGFTVEIKPDRGVGGIYHANTHDNIRFTLKASQDCWFILRYRNTTGTVMQLCPNERYSGGNFLKADIPMVIPDDLPYDFVAQKPYGIDALEVIASPHKIEYLPERDKLAMGTYGGPTALSKELIDRDLSLQQEQQFESFSQGGSYDKAFYNPDAEGNAVIAKTFIRVVP